MGIFFSPVSLELSASLLISQLSPLHFFFFFSSSNSSPPTVLTAEEIKHGLTRFFLSAALLHGWASLTCLLGRAGVGAAMLSGLIQRDPILRRHMGERQRRSFTLDPVFPGILLEFSA